MYDNLKVKIIPLLKNLQLSLIKLRNKTFWKRTLALYKILAYINLLSPTLLSPTAFPRHNPDVQGWHSQNYLPKQLFVKESTSFIQMFLELASFLAFPIIFTDIPSHNNT